MYYTWINKNLMHQFGDQAKVILWYTVNQSSKLGMYVVYLSRGSTALVLTRIAFLYFETVISEETFIGNFVGKMLMRPSGRSRRTWKYNTKMCLNAVRWKVVDWIHLAQDGDSFGEHGNEHSGCMKCGDLFFNYLKLCCYLCICIVMTMYSHCIFMYNYPGWCFSVLFPQL
jgi:hypothetical protein